MACATLLCVPGVGAEAGPSPEGGQTDQVKAPGCEVYELGEIRIHGQRESTVRDVIMTADLRCYCCQAAVRQGGG